MAELSANTAHELNNLINPLSLYLDLLEREIGNGNKERAQAHVRALRQVGQRALEHVEQLRGLARSSQGRELHDVTLNEVAHDAALLVQPRLVERQLKLCCEVGPQVVIRAHHEDLVLSVAHLLDNAVDAAMPGSLIWLRTGGSDEMAWLEISDRGAGMDSACKQSATQPLFTTKPNSAGLGLTLVDWITKRYLGTLQLESDPERGTRARLTFDVPG